MAKTANVGRVSVSMIAETAQYVTKLKAAQKKTDEELAKIRKSYKKTGNSMSSQASKMTKGIGAVAKTGAATVAAIAATVTAVASLTREMANNTREQANLARQAKLTTQEFKVLDIAARQYGSSGEHVADVTKDITDKAQEFARDGTGAFIDFATELELSEDAARAMAAEIVKMSGPDALQFMINKLDEAGLSTDEMVQSMESMGNDVSTIIPLFADGGAELERFKGKMESLTGESDSTNEELLELAENMDIAAQAMSDASKSQIQPLIGFFNELTVATAHFFATLNKNSEAAKYDQMAKLREHIAELKKDIADNETAWGRLGNVLTFTSTESSVLTDELEKSEAQLKSLMDEFYGIPEESSKELVLEIRPKVGDVDGTVPETEEKPKKKEYKSNDQIEAERKAEEAAAAAKMKEQQKAQAEQERLMKEHLDRMDELRIIAAADQMAVIQEQNRQELAAFDEKYTAEEQKSVEFQEARKNLLKQQQKEIDDLMYEKHQQQVDLEIIGAESDIERLRLENQQELEEFRRKYDEQTRMTEEYLKAEAALKEAHRQAEEQAERQSVDDLYGFKRDANGELIATSGAAATAQLGINQVTALGEAWALGPIAGIAASAATVATFTQLYSQLDAAMNSFAVGSNFIPEDQVAKVHKGERIVPAKTNEDLGLAMEQIGDVNEQIAGLNDRSSPISKSMMGEQVTQTTISAPVHINGNVTDQKWFAEQLVKQRNVIAASYEKVQKERPRRR